MRSSNAMPESVNDRFVDDNGNEWVWDGEDYVVTDAEGTRWVFDGEDWLAKGENGARWLFQNDQWLVKGIDGKKYKQDANGDLVKITETTLRLNTPVGTAVAPSTAEPPAQAPGPAKKQHRHRHSHRHKHTKLPVPPKERIEIRAELPTPPPSPPQITVPLPAWRRNDIGVQMPLKMGAEILRFPGGDMIQPARGPPSRPCPHRRPGRRRRRRRSYSSSSSSSSAASARRRRRRSPPRSRSVCGRMIDCLSNMFKSANNELDHRSRPDDVSTASSEQMLKRKNSMSLNGAVSPGAPTPLSPGLKALIPEGSTIMPLSKAVRLERMKKNISGDLTKDESSRYLNPVASMRPGVTGALLQPSLLASSNNNVLATHGDPLVKGLTQVTPLDAYDHYKTMALRLANFPKEMDNIEGRQIMLNELLDLTKSFASMPSNVRSPADELVIIMSNTLQALIKDNLRRMGDGTLADRLWSPRDAYRMDVLGSRTGQIINEANTKLEEVESQLQTVIREVLDLLHHPGAVVRTQEQREKMCKLLESQVEDMFSVRKVFDRLSEECTELREDSEKLAVSDPTCPCRPQAKLIESDCKFLLERLRESTDCLKIVRERLLVSQIREMHQKNRADYFSSQLRALAGKGALSNARVLSLVNEGVERMDNTDVDLEKRLKALEDELDAYKKHNTPDKVPDELSLASRLFQLSKEDEAIAKSRKQSIVTRRFEPLMQPPMRTLPIVEAPELPAVELRITGEESGAVKQLAEVMRQLLDAKEKLTDNTNLDTAIERVIGSIKTIITSVDDGVEVDNQMARQLSKDITKLAFRELPEGLPVGETNMLREIQDMAQRCHNLATDLQSSRPRGHIPFDPQYTNH